MCTKNGSYCENEKERKSQGEGGCVQRMEVIVKRKKSQGGQGRCERRSEAFVKIQKVGLGGQGGCEWRMVKIKKKIFFFWGGEWGLGSGGGGRVVGGQGGWEQRS